MAFQFAGGGCFDLLVNRLHLIVIILHRRGKVAREHFGSVVEQGADREPVYIVLLAEETVAYGGEKMGEKRAFRRVLHQILFFRVEHQAPAADVPHPEDERQKGVVHGWPPYKTRLHGEVIAIGSAAEKHAVRRLLSAHIILYIQNASPCRALKEYPLQFPKDIA